MDSRRMKPQECPLYEDEIRSVEGPRRYVQSCSKSTDPAG